MAGISCRLNPFFSRFLWDGSDFRNTFYWNKTACASGYGDYTKAKIYHWLHTPGDGVFATRIVESEKEPLEGRVYYNYPGQTSTYQVGPDTINRPVRMGRVLDDGSTQLHSYEYNDFGELTKEVDPLGRTFSYVYAANGIDLLETRMTRDGASELLSQSTFDAQHQPLTKTDAAGQTTTYTYNSRGQLLTESDPQGSTTTYGYDTNGYLVSVDGPLPGPDDSHTWTYDSYGRVRTRTDESGYTLIFDYDAFNHFTKITFPDGTYQESAYTRLDLTQSRDRAGRVTLLEYNEVQQMAKRTDPLGRVTQFQWCKCGGLKSLTDPMGRTTSWRNDVQGRVTAKVYPDGSEVQYLYENTTSRLRQRVDEQLQVTQYSYHRDDTVSGMNYANAVIATPPVSFAYDPDYSRLISMADGTGTTRYHYERITDPPALGAGELAVVDGPLPNDTITYRYDELGRRVSTAINGVASTRTFDTAGRVTRATNALGMFTYTYDGASGRASSQSSPNGQTAHLTYGGNLQDQRLLGITNKLGNSMISEFLYAHDVAPRRITSWSQQSGTETPALYSFSYDDANQLIAASVTKDGVTNGTFSYRYDSAGNRLSEEIDGTTNTATYNALNQLITTTGGGNAVTNEWDAEQRLVAVNAGIQRTEFSYDGIGHRVGIRHLENGSEMSHRRFVWCDDVICEERDTNSVVSKRFLRQGMKVETGAAAGSYFYTRDHLSSVRELTDQHGNVRASYGYDPFGRRARVAGDLEADFGFAGMFTSLQAGLSLTQYRAYDPKFGRWLSRDPLKDAELAQGENLYAYVRNDAVNLRDPSGLCCEYLKSVLIASAENAYDLCRIAIRATPVPLLSSTAQTFCEAALLELFAAELALEACQLLPCDPKKKCPTKK